MGLILWIDQNTFATSFLEKVFKKKQLPFYTLSSAEDFSYLVEDIKPTMIVLDSKTAMTHLEQFKAQYETSEVLQSLPFIIVDENPDLVFLKKVIGTINRPFDPFLIPERIQKILNLN